MVHKPFQLISPYKPAGSQPEAIIQLCADRPRKSTLMGVTGSGKTFTMANVIASQDKPVVILSPNKTLAAQLYEEFTQFFPHNKVCYFVSYYDYYQPESYLPAQDVYIAKETKVNVEIERLRLEALASVINRSDTIVITSVSCIYSLGSPSEYRELALSLSVKMRMNRSELLKTLIGIQYVRNEIDRIHGTFQVQGDTVEVHVPYNGHQKLRIELFGDEIESLSWVTRKNNAVVEDISDTIIFPAKPFVSTSERQKTAIKSIRSELERTLPTVSDPQYKERLKSRITYDLEMIQEIGYCSGIENYSSHFDGRSSGQKPYCLLDFFPDDFLLIVDESHVAVPQLRGMYAGDHVRKKNLIEFGFRLPSAFDNRPLKFEEIERYFSNVLFVSATPGEYELQHSDQVTEQIIRPTGLVDPPLEVRKRVGQMDDLVAEVKSTAQSGFRTLVTVLTKRMAEELADYLEQQQIKVCYLHSDLKTPQRTELLHKLRLGIFDCLVGVNLLREGLDLPEVALVAIMDADVAGFLRDKRSLIQTIGRAARNTQSKVLMYADTITDSMRAAIDETNRRRQLQLAYNAEHNIVPTTVQRDVGKSITSLQDSIAQASASKRKKALQKQNAKRMTQQERKTVLAELETKMRSSAASLDFETAISLRDQIRLLAQGTE